MDISSLGIVTRFILGGSAVVASTLIARFLGGRIGGIFAAFPAVYLAAILTIGIGLPSEKILPTALNISKGALVGMLANIICAMAASWFIFRVGWKKGLFYALNVWLVSVVTLYLIFLV